ncbi:DNA-binding XRE family transcriptional regulator [Paraburkholderia atlantica]|uniref:helix-turn-helix domain-containing protein n=1 Tax=Paraburkholderia atlantica TaxID=2654982 RepID=UPI003D2505BB
MNRRHELGLSQRELARRANLANVTICALERGEMCDPKISTLRAIARAVDLDVLLLVMGAQQRAKRHGRCAPAARRLNPFQNRIFPCSTTLSRPSFATATG